MVNWFGRVLRADGQVQSVSLCQWVEKSERGRSMNMNLGHPGVV